MGNSESLKTVRKELGDIVTEVSAETISRQDLSVRCDAVIAALRSVPADEVIVLVERMCAQYGDRELSVASGRKAIEVFDELISP